MSRIEESYLIDLEFGMDLRTAPNGDFSTVSGLENLKQALFNRLITVPGSLAHRPEYGIGIQKYQNSLTSFSRQQALALEIKKQFLEDPRVVDVTSVRIIKGSEGEYIINYKIEAVGIGSVEDSVSPFKDFSL